MHKQYTYRICHDIIPYTEIYIYIYIMYIYIYSQLKHFSEDLGIQDRFVLSGSGS